MRYTTVKDELLFLIKIKSMCQNSSLKIICVILNSYWSFTVVRVFTSVSGSWITLRITAYVFLFFLDTYWPYGGVRSFVDMKYDFLCVKICSLLKFSPTLDLSFFSHDCLRDTTLLLL